jgi:hypothetical protein
LIHFAWLRPKTDRFALQVFMRAYLLIGLIAWSSSGCSLLNGIAAPPSAPIEEAAPIVTAPPAIAAPEVRPAPPPESAPHLPAVVEPAKTPITLPVDPGKPALVAMPWLKPVQWTQLQGWRDDDMAPIWPAFQQS